MGLIQSVTGVDGGLEEVSNWSLNETFDEVLQRRFSRRILLKGVAAAGPLLVLGTSSVACDDGDDAPAQSSSVLGFQPVSANNDDKVTVPPGYETQVVFRWGDALGEGAVPASGVINMTPTQQAGRFGSDPDWIGYFPLKDYKSRDSGHGLLAVNHENVQPDYMFTSYDTRNPTKSQVDVEIAAHGLSIVEVLRERGTWSYKPGSTWNRRITADTEMHISGPAAGSDKLKTTGDTGGNRVRGMLNNCAGGHTPWGTILTCEENFNGYFGNLNDLPDADPRKAIHRRYGITAAGSALGWEKFYDRFNVSREPNEPFRFGWTVEIDPYDEKSTPVKRTALGRMKHEGATVVLSKAGRAVVYQGDDERFDYVYKFVSADKVNTKDRKANFGLLDRGTLYVAKFNESGSGEWLALVHGAGALTASNGFANQADVLLNARGAADLLGATKMDRPEDVEASPVTGKVYAAFTNNTNRTRSRLLHLTRGRTIATAT
jgi:secreted PhoX family phosphatase